MVTDAGVIFKGGQAALFILLTVGYPGCLIKPGMVPPFSWFVEFGYQIVARNRPFFSRFLFTQE